MAPDEVTLAAKPIATAIATHKKETMRLID
jgi:hypothetical protein